MGRWTALHVRRHYATHPHSYVLAIRPHTPGGNVESCCLKSGSPVDLNFCRARAIQRLDQKPRSCSRLVSWSLASVVRELAGRDVLVSLSQIQLEPGPMRKSMGYFSMNPA